MLLKRIISDYRLYEGLIYTHDIDKTVRSLNWNITFDGDVNYITVGDYIEAECLSNNHSLTERDLKFLITTVNNYGYFPFKMRIDGGNPAKFDYNVIKERITDHKWFCVLFMAKYDREYLEENLPNELYHVTLERNVPKIIKVGLCPKNKDKISINLPRVYFSKTVAGIKNLLNDRRFIKNEKSFVIFKIDVKTLVKERDIRWIYDPEFKNHGIYTYENIPPKYLTMIEKVVFPN